MTAGRTFQWVAAAVLLSAVGYVGYSVGSSSGTHQPAYATEAIPAMTEIPQISDPVARPVPAAGAGRDALTPDEVTKARSLAVDAGLRAGAADVTGQSGPEILSVQLADATAGQAARRATVLLYDYRTDRLLKRAVDLTAGRVDGSFAAARMQPPPTTREISTAADVLWKDKSAAVLRERFEASTGTPLTSLSQLTIEAQTFTADAGEHGAAAECGAHRCLTLLPRPQDRPYLDLTDLVIDLSARTVARAGT
jgi:hypothetical protein